MPLVGTWRELYVGYLLCSGRSLGSGWVVFETRVEAEAAKKEYHGVKLDEQPMEIAFADATYGGGAPLTKLSSGIL